MSMSCVHVRIFARVQNLYCSVLRDPAFLRMEAFGSKTNLDFFSFNIFVFYVLILVVS